MRSRIVKAFSDRPVKTMFTLLAVVVLTGAAIYKFAEEVSYGDGLWWAIVTATTVGYGDIAPETPGMRLVAVSVMFTGIVTASIVTASIAATIVSTRLRHVDQTQEIDDDFDYVIERMRNLQQRYREDERGDDSVLRAAHALIDAHRSGSNGDLKLHVERLDAAVRHQEHTDA